MVYGGASHLSPERTPGSARLGAPTREEADAWELLQKDDRSDHIGPRVPNGRLPLPAPGSGDCRQCHRTATSRVAPPEHDTSIPSARGALAGADVELCARADRAEFLAKGQLRSESSQDDPVRRALSWFPLFFLPGHRIALRVVSSSATSTS